ncbi:MAG TPA: FAD-dependent monooxygenase, partial [Burkholderiaceae bacterium]|nr:FAD-dependent monooxygenase [Burkholderiaceae bacterium]
MSGIAAAQVSVAIVGGGPNGIALANLLGAYGVRTVVIEREREILEYPRAVGMDDEALRLFQTVALAEPLLENMIPNVPLRMFRTDGRCFADIRASTREFGWWRRNIFMQQIAEVTLRGGLARYPSVELRLGEQV